MDQIFVFFPDDEKVGVKPIRSYSEKMQEEDVKKAIIVIKGGITPFARSAIQELCAQREVCTHTVQWVRGRQAAHLCRREKENPTPLLQTSPVSPSLFALPVLPRAMCLLVLVGVTTSHRFFVWSNVSPRGLADETGLLHESYLWCVVLCSLFAPSFLIDRSRWRTSKTPS